jgi:hypothetical protein
MHHHPGGVLNVTVFHGLKPVSTSAGLAWVEFNDPHRPSAQLADAFGGSVIQETGRKGLSIRSDHTGR